MIAVPELGTAPYRARALQPHGAMHKHPFAGCVFTFGEHRFTPLSKSLHSLKWGQS